MAAVATGDGGEGSPIETDPLGGSVGTFTPYFEPVVWEPEPDQPLLLVFGSGGGSNNIPGMDFGSLYATFGSRIADLPGFGTNWGSVLQLAEQQYSESVWNATHGLGFNPNEYYGGPPGARLIGFGYSSTEGTRFGGTWTYEDAVRRAEGQTDLVFANWDEDYDFGDEDWGTLDDDLDKIYNTPPCDVAKFEELKEAQQQLIGGAAAYNALSQLQRAVFVNITGALLKAGANLDGLKLQSGGVLNDRLFFTPESVADFKTSIQALTKSQPKVFDSKDFFLRQFGGHSGMKDYMARQTVSENSLQVGFGKKGAYADIDLWNPDYEFGKHQDEIKKNDAKKGIVTPHFYLAKVLGNCK